jgi:hypothetical protein
VKVAEAPPAPLTERQAEVYEAIVDYCRFMRAESCPASYVAERLGLSYETVRRHYFPAIARKGWINQDRNPASSPAFLARR